MARPNSKLLTRYEDDLRLWPTWWTKAAVLALVVVYLWLPSAYTDYQLLVLNYCGVAAIGAIGLNLLTGYTGQVSLGHAFFVGVGAYTVAYLGGVHGWPLWLWLPTAGVIGGLIGALIGPFALRLRGNYLVIVTLGLVFVGQHLFENWDTVTGGNTGRTVTTAPMKIGPLDFAQLKVGNLVYTREQSFFWLIWAVVGVTALVAKNIVRSRPGRAMQAVRDRDVAAEVIGVSLPRYKVSAFAVSSAMAAIGGGLYGALQQRIGPGDFGLLLSIQYIAIVIVGGVGTIFGAVLGAIVLGAVPRIVDTVSRNNDLPFVSGDRGGADGFIALASLNQIIFGAFIVLFLLFEPRGLAAVWLRIKAWFKAWPFSY